MAVKAALCVAGVTPAQQLASTVISVSGKTALRIRTLEITQISVHKPITSISEKRLSPSRFAQSVKPKVGLSICWHFKQSISFTTRHPVRSPDAVRYRQMSALVCVQILLSVRIAGEYHIVSGGKICVNFTLDIRQNRHRFFRAECSGNKIVLYVNYNKSFQIQPPQSMIASPGNFTSIVVPRSELSFTRISPPCSATISHTNESPSPTPPFSRLRDLSARKKG